MFGVKDKPSGWNRVGTDDEHSYWGEARVQRPSPVADFLDGYC